MIVYKHKICFQTLQYRSQLFYSYYAIPVIPYMLLQIVTSENVTVNYLGYLVHFALVL